MVSRSWPKCHQIHIKTFPHSDPVSTSADETSDSSWTFKVGSRLCLSDADDSDVTGNCESFVVTEPSILGCRRYFCTIRRRQLLSLNHVFFFTDSIERNDMTWTSTSRTLSRWFWTSTTAWMKECKPSSLVSMKYQTTGEATFLFSTTAMTEVRSGC